MSELPMTVRDRRPARARSRSTRSARATACRTRRRSSRSRSRRSSSAGCSPPGCPIVEATSFVHPKWVPQLADAEELMDLLGDARPRPARCWCPTSAASTGRSSSGCRHVAIFGSATETFAQKNLNRSLDEQFAMFEPDRTPGPRRRARRARLRLDVLRRPVGGRRPDRPGRRRRQAALRPRRQPAQPRRHHRRRHGRPRRPRCVDAFDDGRAAPTTSSRCTSTTPTARRWPTRYAGAAARRHDVRRERRRPRRLPLRQERHRQPRHRGPGLDAAPASASSTASTSTRWSRPAPGWPASSAARAPPPSSAPSRRLPGSPYGIVSRTTVRHGLPVWTATAGRIPA